MDQRDADIELEGEELATYARGSIAYMKQLVERCLDADIPATLGRSCEAGKG